MENFIFNPLSDSIFYSICFSIPCLQVGSLCFVSSQLPRAYKKASENGFHLSKLTTSTVSVTQSTQCHKVTNFSRNYKPSLVSGVRVNDIIPIQTTTVSFRFGTYPRKKKRNNVEVTHLVTSTTFLSVTQKHQKQQVNKPPPLPRD